MRNESGAINIALLALLPLLLATCAVMAGAYLTLQADSKLKHLCRNELLAAQEIATDRLNQLIALNPEAKTLRAARSAAEKTFLLAPTPEAKTAAKLALDAITAKQNIFGLEQKHLYLEGTEASTTRPFRMNLLMKGMMQADQARHVDNVSNNSLTLDFRIQINPGAFDLIVTPADSPTPDYQPAPRFKETQKMRASWSFNLKAWLPKWTQDIVGNFNERFKGACSAGVEKGEEGWRARLNMDKR